MSSNSLSDGKPNDADPRRETLLVSPGRPEFVAALGELLKAYEYAQEVARDAWDFAVEIAQLRRNGLTGSDFRWLRCKGYVEHAREVTRLEDQGRTFLPTGELSFCRRTCFVLTSAGAVFTRNLLHNGAAAVVVEDCGSSPGDGERQTPRQVPEWDRRHHELRCDGKLVKQFKLPALNQETILSAFEEEGWPARIDDPLPPELEQDPKRRLHDAIKCLNRNQVHVGVHFRGDGTGEGITWELLDTPDESRPLTR